VQKNQRDGEEREPDVTAQPALHISYRQKREFLAHAEQRRKHKNA